MNYEKSPQANVALHSVLTQKSEITLTIKMYSHKPA